MTNNLTYYSPIYLAGQTTFDRIAIRAASNFSGNGIVRLGIYNSSNGKPTTVLLDAGTVSTSAASTTYAITINQTLDSGWYWLVANSQTNATTNSYVGSTNAFLLSLNLLSTAFAPQVGWTESGISGAFATAGSLTRTANAIQVGLRVS